jgi:hypothetical protein
MKELTPGEERLLVKWLIDIYKMGDRDECSLKHIGHGMAALLAFDDWTQAVDYNRPTDRQFFRAEEVKLDALWACVKKIVRQVGIQSILSALPRLATEYNELSYINHYLELEHYTYRKQLEDEYEIGDTFWQRHV